MRTKRIKIGSETEYFLLKEPAKSLAEGGLVVFPTETVYGLGANALLEESVKNIFKAKGRPSDNPLIVHVASKNQVSEVVSAIPKAAEKVMEHLWPGPITLIMPRASRISNAVTAGLDTVAVRFPSHPVARRLLVEAGVPVAAPSANTSGRPSPTKAAHVVEDLDGKVDYILDGGNCSVGLESTVLDTTVTPPQILRPGGISKQQLEEILGQVVYDPGLTNQRAVPKSPGMKYKHYAPKAQMTIVEGKDIAGCIGRLLEKELTQGKKIGVLTSGNHDYPADFIIDAGESAEEYAANLFDALREFDAKGADVILAELPFGESGIEPAIRNRIYKAAGGNVIKC